MSDGPSEQTPLNQVESDEHGQLIRLNENDRDDPGKSVPFNQNGKEDPGNSVSLNRNDNDDFRESMCLNLNTDDPRELIRLNQYYSDLGYSRKTQVRNDIIFTTSAVGLVELGNVVYSKLCEISPQFADCVSSSMFMYYVSQLHYMRLCVLEWAAPMPESEDLHIMEGILHNKWIVPQLLADYFNSIGSFKDSAGVFAEHRELVFPSAQEIEGINGFYGRVDGNTHTHYENRISPGVAARRIIEDLMFTHIPFRRLLQGFWNLPRILVPAEKNARGPTGNLLGWSLATALTPMQVNALKECGVSLDDGKFTFSHCTQFCHNGQLMSYVSAQLDLLRGKVKCVDRLSTTPEGSIVQHDFQLVASHEGLHRIQTYGDTCTYNLGYTPLRMHQELHAHVFRLRMYRRKMLQAEGLTISPWCCYDFNSYREVPDSWSKTCNLYFLFGRLKVWDIANYKTQPADLGLLLARMMAETLIQ